MNPEHRNSTQGGARLEKKQQTSRPGNGKRPKPRLTRKQKTLRILFLVLTIIAAIIVVGTVVFLLVTAPPDASQLSTPRPQTTTVIDENGNEIEVEIPGLAANRKEQFYTFLLVGQDTGGGGLTDTMMLAAYDVPNQTMNVMSLPRDTYVRYGSRNVLLNSVYNRAGGGKDGIEALKAEVGDLTGVTPDFYVIVQWEAVGELVDAIDGVYFDVPLDMNYEDPDQDLYIHLDAGMQLIDGDKAMQLLRWRKNNKIVNGHLVIYGGYPNGDLGRIETQQAFLTAVLEKCLQPNVLLPNLMEYVTIFQKNVETDLSIPNMAYFGKSAANGLDMSQVEFITMPYKDAGDNSHLLPVGSEIVEAINDGFNPYDREITLRDLDLVTSIYSSGSSSSSGSTSTSTSEPSATPSAVPTEEPAVSATPDQPVMESPSESAAPGQSPAASAAPSQDPAASSSPAATPTPEVPPTSTPVFTPDPVPTPAATPGGNIEYGPGMEPVA